MSVDHLTVFRWVQPYAPELDKRGRPLWRMTHESYRVDETYSRINHRQSTSQHQLSTPGSGRPGSPCNEVSNEPSE